jgi:hypothetical protein
LLFVDVQDVPEVDWKHEGFTPPLNATHWPCVTSVRLTK